MSAPEQELIRTFTTQELLYVMAQHVANEPAFRMRFGDQSVPLRVVFEGTGEDQELVAKVYLRSGPEPQSESEAPAEESSGA